MPLPAWAVYGGLTAGGALVNALKGESEQEKLFKRLQAEADKPESELGFSEEEKGALRFGAKSRLRGGAAERIAQRQASAARRGGVVGPQADIETETEFSKGFRDFIPQIDIESARLGRARKDRLTNLLAQYGMALPSDDISGDIGGLSETLAMLALMDRDKNDTDIVPRPSTASPRRF